MELSPEQREQVRLALLRYCLRESRVGLLRANLTGEGYRLAAADVKLGIVQR